MYIYYVHILCIYNPKRVLNKHQQKHWNFQCLQNRAQAPPAKGSPWGIAKPVSRPTEAEDTSKCLEPGKVDLPSGKW